MTAEPTTQKKRGLYVGVVLTAIAVITAIALISPHLMRSRQLMAELHDAIQKDVLPLSKHILGYSLDGYYGNILNMKLSEDFDSLPLKERYGELRGLMDKYNYSREVILATYNLKYDMNIYPKDSSQFPVIIAQTTSNKYEYESIDFLTVNGELHSPKDFGFTDPVDNLTPSSPTLVEPTEDEKAFAWTAALQEVKAKLKSPSTAEFPFSYSGQYIMKSGDTYTIESYVDAENSFGAKIRKNFKVLIEKIDENHYNVISVEIYE